MSKRKIIIMKYDGMLFGMGGFEEVKTIPVARHKGLPEAQQTAVREIAKLNKGKVPTDGTYGYVIMQDDCQLVGFTNDLQ